MLYSSSRILEVELEFETRDERSLIAYINGRPAVLLMVDTWAKYCPKSIYIVR